MIIHSDEDWRTSRITPATSHLVLLVINITAVTARASPVDLSSTKHGINTTKSAVKGCHAVSKERTLSFQ
jgi:hypothetical protein